MDNHGSIEKSWINRKNHGSIEDPGFIMDNYGSIEKSWTNEKIMDNLG